MKSHTIDPGSVANLVLQADNSFDVTKDYKVMFSVEDGVVHTTTGIAAKTRNCPECVRYQELLERRERESYPNVADEE